MRDRRQSEKFQRFQYFDTDFLENENLFQKTGVLFFKLKALRFFIQTRASFPYKPDISEANVKTNSGDYKMDLSQRTDFYQ